MKRAMEKVIDELRGIMQGILDDMHGVERVNQETLNRINEADEIHRQNKDIHESTLRTTEDRLYG